VIFHDKLNTHNGCAHGWKNIILLPLPFSPRKRREKSKQRMEMAALNLLMGRRAPLAFTAAQIYR
jgi:hypothetical protein